MHWAEFHLENFLFITASMDSREYCSADIYQFGDSPVTDVLKRVKTILNAF